MGEIMTVQPYQATAYNGQPQQGTPQLQGLGILVHSPQKIGKSSVAQTGPGPCLVLDVETAATWTPALKVYWNPLRETCPTWPADPRAATPANPQGLWDVCVVIIHDFDTLVRLLQFLERGQHPFNSIAVDSVTTIQQHLMLQMVPYGRKLEYDHWGKVLQAINLVMHGYRKLLTHPVRKVWAVTFICQTHFDKRTGKWRPLLSGQSQDLAPYVPDLTGWMYVGDDGYSRHLWIGPSKSYETGDRLWGRLPQDMVIGWPGLVEGWTVEAMVRQVIQR
jgi:hypothetical protein